MVAQIGRVTYGPTTPATETGVLARPRILVKDTWIPPELAAQLKAYDPKTHLGRAVKACFAYLPAEQARDLLDRILSAVVIETSLGIVVFRTAESPCGRGRREIEDYGIVCRKVVTDAGVAAIVDAFENIVEPEIYNYHGIGTGTTAEAVTGAGAALVTEWAGADYTGGVRATGTQSEPTAPQYRSVGTNTKLSAGTSAITEHVLASSATVGGGVTMDRSVFAAVNLGQSDSIQSTHTTTYASGG